MKGNCACGTVTVTLAAKPEYINLCDCSLCAPIGGAWGYFATADVVVSGETRGYRRVERDAPAVEIRFCTICGSTTHWILTEHHPGGRMGVNMRIFDPALSAGIETHTLDGRNWDGTTDAAHRRPSGILGEDVFL